ncbi:hypothetical protein [Williamsia phyllosphaerae]|uniref:Uncharacterized protein n=1 Tax=Williamsia phyllosphaerae TaxID=885042 RepID=A0ABQ1V2J7_9NOCA|nr:hypothetical protein [Williamsia phyllosphaerae]GGF35642.1 hypothetical protein GCM10007298_34320 [Williamsia phyllosphaerae]
MGHTNNPSGIREWRAMAEWIATSLTDKPVGMIFEIGPAHFIYHAEHDQDVACVQAVILEDGVVMLRRSREMLLRLNVVDFRSRGLPIYRWLMNGHFEDCTDGYIFSRDQELLAGAVVAWFRDTCGIASPDDLGCEYSLPDTLMPDHEEEEIDDSEFI